MLARNREQISDIVGRARRRLWSLLTPSAYARLAGRIQGFAEGVMIMLVIDRVKIKTRSEQLRRRLERLTTPSTRAMMVARAEGFVLGVTVALIGVCVTVFALSLWEILLNDREGPWWVVMRGLESLSVDSWLGLISTIAVGFGFGLAMRLTQGAMALLRGSINHDQE